MTEEEKKILLSDICARIPYGLILRQYSDNYMNDYGITTDVPLIDILQSVLRGFLTIRPYLRPLSSMTDEEFKKLIIYTELQYDQLVLKDWDNGCKTLEFYLSEIPHYCVNKVFDWLNRHHFDHRGLIEQGLALEAPKNMYKII